MIQNMFKASLLLGLVVALGCGGSEDAGGSGGSAEVASNFGTVTLAPGFTPDPATATGNSGGARDASSVSPGCNGWISETPDHVLVATGDFANLRVMAAANTAGDDITMVIQKPDGTYLCDDDGGDALDPTIDGAMPAGTYKIWVGSYSEGEHVSYKLGITEMMTTTTDTLRGS